MVRPTTDIAVFELLKGRFGYLGTGGGKIVRDRRLQCVLTLVGGEVVYDHPYGLSQPLWQDVPKDPRYWVNTNKQNW